MIVRDLMMQDGAELWMKYLEELIKWMGIDNLGKIQAGLQCLIIIFEEIDDSIYPLAPKLLMALFQIFTKPDVRGTQSKLTSQD